MVLFEMDASHLYNVEVREKGKTGRGVVFEIPIDSDHDIFGLGEGRDPHMFSLKQVAKEKGTTFVMNYDFGDDWKISIKLKKIFDIKNYKKSKFPHVISGSGYGIIEDCGGVWGLSDIVQAFEEKAGEKYEEFSEYLEDKNFDITQFDVEVMNERVKNEPDIFRLAYTSLM
jgi:hypothetical protein